MRTTAVLEFMARDFPQAFPPTVTPETTADSSSVMKISEPLLLSSSTRAEMTAAAEPEMTPQMSPITSLQNDETRPALRMSRSASSASGTLR